MKENTNSKETQRKKDYTWRWLGLWLFVLLVVCLVYPFILRGVILWLNPGNMEKYGVIGDMYGAPNAFISGCAFIGVVYSLLQQKKQLELQRKDLKLQRNDLALQREEMQKARKEAERQTQQFKEQVQIDKEAQFRDDFYRRVELLNSLRNNLTYVSKGWDARLGTTERFERKGISAWENVHYRVKMYLRTDNGNTPVYQCNEALTSLIPYYASLCYLIDDIIRYFDKNKSGCISDSGDKNAEHFIIIIFNTLSSYEKDFLYLMLDVLESPSSLRVREYLYSHSFLKLDNNTPNAFAMNTKQRDVLLQELRENFSR